MRARRAWTTVFSALLRFASRTFSCEALSLTVFVLLNPKPPARHRDAGVTRTHGRAQPEARGPACTAPADAPRLTARR